MGDLNSSHQEAGFNGYPILYGAVLHNQRKRFLSLMAMKKHVDVNAVNHAGVTCLHLACSYAAVRERHIIYVDSLIQAGADVNAEVYDESVFKWATGLYNWDSAVALMLLSA